VTVTPDTSAALVAVRDTVTMVDDVRLGVVDVLVIPDSGVPWPAMAVNVGQTRLDVRSPGGSSAVPIDVVDPSTPVLA
jgi:hypothetical protein